MVAYAHMHERADCLHAPTAASRKSAPDIKHRHNQACIVFIVHSKIQTRRTTTLAPILIARYDFGSVTFHSGPASARFRARRCCVLWTFSSSDIRPTMHKFIHPAHTSRSCPQGNLNPFISSNMLPMPTPAPFACWRRPSRPSSFMSFHALSRRRSPFPPPFSLPFCLPSRQKKCTGQRPWHTPPAPSPRVSPEIRSSGTR